ncbi:MAG: amidohydrolase family protein [Oscillospiraceae bacterium]
MNTYIIKGGRVYDPQKNAFSVRDIAFRDGVLISPSKAKTNVRILNADGCLVSPGLIDFHMHLAAQCSDNGVAPDPICLPSGVTTAVDAGTAGYANYEAFRLTDAAHAITDVRACLHVSPAGMTTWAYMEDGNPKHYSLPDMKKLFDKYPAELVAIKTRVSRSYIAPTGLLKEPLEAALRLAEQLDRPLVVHVTDPAFSLDELAQMLRRGDIFCHVYQGIGETILDGDGHVRPAIRKARERGVLFDAANGMRNYDSHVALSALSDGFEPDIISTDITVATQYLEPVHSLPVLMSKYYCMGMPWEKIFRTVTAVPAAILQEPEKASLQDGTKADLAVFREKDIPITFPDAFGGHISGHTVLVPQLTVKDGRIVYRQVDF